MVCVLLAVGAVVTKPLRGLIPDLPTNALSNETADYLVAASHQPINWQPLTPNAFVDAKRLERPVIALVGVAWSRQCSDLDETLSDPALQLVLQREYVCTRVDEASKRDMVNLYLPVSQERVGLRRALQIWFLDSDGQPFGYFALSKDSPALPAADLLRILQEERDIFDKPDKRLDTQRAIAKLQRADQDIVGLSPVATTDFDSYLRKLQTSIDPVNGGSPYASIQQPRPWALRYLYLNGDRDSFDKALKPMLASSLVDAIDGGFYSQASSPDWTKVEFSKAGCQEAELMTTLAIASVGEKSPYLRYLADHAFDNLTTNYWTGGTYISARLDSSSGLFHRDPRASVSPNRLLQLFPSASDRDWVSRQLDLDPTVNEQAAPRIKDTSGFDDARLANDLTRIRETAAKAKYTKMGYLDEGATVVARLMETSRYLQDPTRLDKAVELLDDLKVYQRRNAVLHDATSGASESYLTDYVALADAYMQLYLTTGRYEGLLEAKRLTREAIQKFKGPQKGVFYVGTGRSLPFVASFRGPELLDSFGESATAKLLRLCHSLGSTEPRQSASLFRETASDIEKRFRFAGEAFGPLGGGLMCALAQVQKDTIYFCSGPRADELRNKLNLKMPGTLVIPLEGDVRSDIQAKGQGVFVDTKGEITLVEGEAAQ